MGSTHQCLWRAALSKVQYLQKDALYSLVFVEGCTLQARCFTRVSGPGFGLAHSRAAEAAYPERSNGRALLKTRPLNGLFYWGSALTFWTAVLPRGGPAERFFLPGPRITR
ncbi:hypothetical protein NDU88_002105 [Pleurodeles waltl]|uniref:Uncharacterized protein n=1 Tax=Pleurodeles waltl TaxID=8319 RepID=A0AAV7VDK3_PLEWA|nr:hypothetical protein NDU88_002105 [Pleurodeles waltl]